MNISWCARGHCCLLLNPVPFPANNVQLPIFLCSDSWPGHQGGGEERRATKGDMESLVVATVGDTMAVGDVVMGDVVVATRGPDL